MIRSYALVIMNNEDKIIDRYNLDLVTNPTGNGFELELSTISTDIDDVITKVVQKKPTITMTISQVKNVYSKANQLAGWIQKYSTADSQMFLEYNDTTVTKYCGGKVTKLTKTEKNEYKELAQDLTFTMTTPFFEKKENNIFITKSTNGKAYNYAYDYNYANDIIENNTINNTYILDVPIILSLTGAIVNPTIDLLDENGERYSRIQFNDFILSDDEKLIINSAQKKIYKVFVDADGNELKNTLVDFRSAVNPQYDTFLLAQPGTTTISININDASDTFNILGTWRQYTL